MDPLERLTLIPSPTDHLTPKPAPEGSVAVTEVHCDHCGADVHYYSDPPTPSAAPQNTTASDSNVHNLILDTMKPKSDNSEYVLYCECGNRTWYMHMDGIPRCAVCDRNAPTSNPTWYQQLPPIPADPLTIPPPPTQLPTSNIIQWNTEEQTMHYLLNHIESRWMKLTGAVLIHMDGFMQVWTRDDIKEDAPLRDWYKRRMEDAWRIMVSK